MHLCVPEYIIRINTILVNKEKASALDSFVRSH